MIIKTILFLLLLFNVVQQPSNHSLYVASTPNTFTQFGMSTVYGNLGLLAHDYAAGKDIANLQDNDFIIVEYSDGSKKTFIVTDVLRYQAMQPNSPYSSFRDLNDNTLYTAEQLFKRVYYGDYLTLQTCIERNGDLSWGRLFVVALPEEKLKLHR